MHELQKLGPAWYAHCLGSGNNISMHSTPPLPGKVQKPTWPHSSVFSSYQGGAVTCQINLQTADLLEQFKPASRSDMHSMNLAAGAAQAGCTHFNSTRVCSAHRSTKTRASPPGAAALAPRPLQHAAATAPHGATSAASPGWMSLTRMHGRSAQVPACSLSNSTAC